MLSTDELLTIADVAHLLRLQPRTIGNWLREGKLQGIKLGNKSWRIRRRDLEKLLEQENMAIQEIPTTRTQALDRYFRIGDALARNIRPGQSALKQLLSDRQKRQNDLLGDQE